MLDLGLITVNYQPIIDYLSGQSPVSLVFQFIAIIGWLPIVNWILHTIVHDWVHYKQEKLVHHWEYAVLAVDIPQLNVQTPKAVEQMFTHLSGAYDEISLSAKFRTGYEQRCFSFEIISIGGYIQFLVRTEILHRDLIEAAIYAQYPEATITEVHDYTNEIPDSFPNDTYDAWGADFVLTEHEGYAIRTYDEFEHSIAADTVIKDPMGTFLESFSRIGPGEQMWFQIIIEPVGNGWKEHVIEKIEELTGGESHHGSSWLDTIIDAPMKFLEIAGDQVFGREASEAHEEDHGEHKLAPGQGKAIEGMERKMQKVGFETMIRGLYIARKEVFRPERGMHALIGAMTQYNVLSSNCFAAKPGSAKDMVSVYKSRTIKGDNDPYVLNIEELATIWHFPMSHVKTPLIQKTLGKHAEPPSGLPVERIPLNNDNKSTPKTPTKSSYKTDAGHMVDTDNMRFG